MSTLTKIWTEEKIRDIIRHLDEKTGLSGATLPIAFNSYGNLLGYYRYVKPKAFGFNRKFFDDPSTGEAEVIDVIRHEYAHYYVDVANLELFVGHSRREMSHGDDWKWACGMVGADPTRCHNAALFMGKIWSDKDAMAAYNASDIPKCDIIPYLKRWNAVPINVDTAIKINARIKEALLIRITRLATRFSIRREDLASCTTRFLMTILRRRYMFALRTDHSASLLHRKSVRLLMESQ